MATRNPTIDRGKGAAVTGDGSIVRAWWTGIAAATSDIGAPVPFVEWNDWSIQFATLNLATGAASTLDAGSTLSLYGSNDYIPALEENGNVANAGTWSILASSTGSAVTMTANTAGQIFYGYERSLWVRLAYSAGNGTGTSVLNAVLIGNRTQPQITGG
jgi:hypothetical protein